MLSNIIGLFIILFYTSWHIIIIHDRAKRSQIKDYPVNFLFDVAYFMIMIFLLAKASFNFLVLGLVATIIHLLFGFSTVVFKPQIDMSKFKNSEIMRNYWTYVTMDFLVMIGSYIIMSVAGGIL